MLLTILLIFILGYIGYRLFDFLHIPGGAVTGALVLSAIITSWGVLWAEFPSHFITFFQVIIGIMIGCKFDREKLATMKSLLVPGLLSSTWMILISLGVGYLLAELTGVELGTALYGSVPAGLMEMGLIALSFNLNVPVVTLLQFVRVISINLGVPPIVAKCNHLEKEGQTGQACQMPVETGIVKNSPVKTDIGNLLLALLLGAIGGFTAKYFEIPVGGMLGAMMVIGSLRTLGVRLVEPPPWLILITQIIIGGYLGTTFTSEMVTSLKSLLFPVLFFSVFVVVNGLFIGFMLHKILKWDLATSLLSTAAGGVTLMTLTAIEIHADPIKVSLLQSLRLTIILLIMPTLIAFIIQ